MFEHKLGYAEWLTQNFYAITERMGFHLSHHSMDHVWMALFVLIFCTAFFSYWKKRFGVYPGIMQQVLETYYGFVQNLCRDVIGPRYQRYFPLIATLGIFILLSNLMGLIPAFKSATANINVTLACSILVFFYYHYQGIRENGLLKYLKHFAGPVWWLSWLFIPVEVIGHFSRPLSLSVRLFGNVFGKETIIMILSMLVPFFVPLPLMCLAVFISMVQTLVFIMLSAVYIAGAIAHEESHGEEVHVDTYMEPIPAH